MATAKLLAATDIEQRVGFALVFPRRIFRNVRLFRTVGGWRGFNTLILEASNGRTSNLKKAIETGQSGILQPGETLASKVLAVAYSGCTGVERVEPDGRVIARQS